MPNNHLVQWLAQAFCSGFLLRLFAQAFLPRPFFPKKMPLYKVTEKELFKATDLMNNRPRKCLGYKTPWEVFFRVMGIDHNINPSVALMG